MTANVPYPFWLALIPAAFASLGAPGAAADVLVLASDAPGVAAGAVLADGATLDVPQGARVSVMTPGGRTVTLRGPVSKTIGDLGGREKRDETLWNDVRAALPRPLEGAGDSSRSARRGFSAAPAPTAAAVAARPASFSWRRVPVETEGDYCIEKGAGLVLTRSQFDKPAVATLVDMQASSKADVAFKAGGDEAPWPVQITARAGAFAIAAPGQPQHEFRLRIITPLPPAEDTLRVLHGQRCQKQIQAWLQGLAVASR